MTGKIKYQAIWGKLYILLGVLFGLLFIIGGIILDDYTVFLNILASVIIIYIGISMLRRPYAEYSANEIKVYSFIGSVRHHYKFDQKEVIQVRDKRLYLNGKRLNPHYALENLLRLKTAAKSDAMLHFLISP